MNAYRPSCSGCGAPGIGGLDDSRAAELGAVGESGPAGVGVARGQEVKEPAASEPGRLVMGIAVALADDEGRLLLRRDAGSRLWALPGGMDPTETDSIETGLTQIDHAESLPQAAIRVVRQETGLDIVITGLIGLYTDARQVIAASGQVRRQVAVVLSGRVSGGRLIVGQESTQLEWVEPRRVEELPMRPAQRLRLRHVLEGRAQPYIG